MTDNIAGLVEEINAIGEEEMYLAPASTRATLDRAATALTTLSRQVEEMREAASELEARAFRHYRARNGRLCTIEDGGGEAAWIVPHDAMEDLRASLSQEEGVGNG